MDLDAMAVEDTECAVPHVAGKEDGDALLFQDGGDIGLASAAWRGKDDADLLKGKLVIGTEEGELGAVAEVVINGAVGAGGDGNDGVHF